MADNTGEEPFNNPANTQSENPSGEIFPAKDNDTINPNQQTENMETHAQELHKAPGQGWKHYLFEFFMLFLAVFCGFIAENIRENIVEHSKEKEYIQSLANDLSIDTARLHNIIDSRNQREALLDSLMILMKLPHPTERSTDIYYYNSFASRMTFRFNSDDGTLQQLKNAGNLRLISKQQVSDSLMSYDVGARTRAKNDDEEVVAMEAYRIVAQEIFDGSELEKTRDANNDVHRLDYNPIIKDNKDAVFKLIYRIHMLKNFNRTGQRESKAILQKATNLLAILKKEYHLE